MFDDFFAYNGEYRGTETVMRLQSVKRWHMIETTRIQTLAEHSANVALLAMLIAKTAEIESFNTYTTVATAALCHDLAEVFTGDIPTHSKDYLEGLDELEHQLLPAAFTGIEITESTRALIKLCDLADGIRFIRIHGVDKMAVNARVGLEDRLMTLFETCRTTLEWPPHLSTHVRFHVMLYAHGHTLGA